MSTGAFLTPNTPMGVNHMWVPDTYSVSGDGEDVAIALCGLLSNTNYTPAHFPNRDRRLCKTCSKALAVYIKEWFRWREWAAVLPMSATPPKTGVVYDIVEFYDPDELEDDE